MDEQEAQSKNNFPFKFKVDAKMHIFSGKMRLNGLVVSEEERKQELIWILRWNKAEWLGV